MTEAPAWADRLAVFDTETTGVDPHEARIVTAFVGLIDARGDVERGTDWLADPGVEIPEQAAAVHGITTEMAQAEGEPAAQVVAAVRAAIEWIARHRVPLVVFNAPYDLTLLDAECRRHGLEPVGPLLGEQVVDPLVIDKAVDRFRRGKRTLTAQAEAYGIELLDAHSAGDDAVASGQLAQGMARKFPDEVGSVPLDELHRRQAAWHDEQAADFEAYLRREKDPSYTAPRGWPVRP